MARIDTPMIVDCGAIDTRKVKPGRVDSPTQEASLRIRRVA